MDPLGPRPGRAEPPPRGRHQRRGLPLQEQHGLGRQLLRLPRELPLGARRRAGAPERGDDPVPREPPDLLGSGQGPPHRQGPHLLRQPARRAHLGVGLLGDDAEPAHHQHPRRAPRRRRALPPPPRDRGRHEHVRVRDLPEGGCDLPHARHGGGRLDGAARPHAREPDPCDPRDLPGPDLQAQGPARERPRDHRAADPVRVPRPRHALRGPSRTAAGPQAGARDVAALRDTGSARTRCRSTARSTGS